MSSTITPNMSLIVPGVGTEPGPTWGTDLNSDLGILDQHNHSSGQGVQINPSGININADLPINGNNLTFVKTVNFQSQPSSLPGAAPNLGAVYVAGNELYYNDESGNVVAITKTGSVNAGAGSITGLPSGTASASYNSGSQTFVWQSATNTPANMDGGSFIFRDITANSHGVTLSAPTALASNLQLFLPAALPASTSLVTIDTAGNITTFPASPPVSNSVVTVSSSGVLGTAPFLGPNIVYSSGDSGAFSTTGIATVTNMNVTITTRGGPVEIRFAPANGEAVHVCGIGGTTGGPNTGGVFQIYAGATPTTVLWQTSLTSMVFGVSGNTFSIGPSALNGIDLSVVGSPGTYTYTLVVNASNQIFVNYVMMYAYELGT